MATATKQNNKTNKFHALEEQKGGQYGKNAVWPGTETVSREMKVVVLTYIFSFIPP